MADDDDDCEFPEDWGEAAPEDGSIVEAEAVLEDECEDAVMEEDPAGGEDDGAVDLEEDAAVVEDDVVDELDGGDAELPADVGGQEAEAETVNLDDGEEEEDDDLAAEEAAALAALEGSDETAEEVELGEADDVIEDKQAASAQHGLRPSAKAPIRPLVARPPLARPPQQLAVRVPVAKLPAVQPPWSRGPIQPVGKTPSGKGPAAAGSYKGGKPMVSQGIKGGKAPWSSPVGSSHGAHAINAKGKGNVGPGQKGHIAGKGFPFSSAPVAAGKGAAKATPVRPATLPDSRGKAKGKATASLGHRVLALNKAGHWATGRGISVQALKELKDLSESSANKILDDLEAKAASVQNPSKFIQLAAAPQSSAGAASANGKAAGGKGSGAPGASGAAAAKPPWRADAAAGGAAAAGKGVKRPAPSGVSADPPTKRIVPPTAAAAKTELSPQVRAKVQDMQKQMEIRPEALPALASVEPRDALILLQALLNRAKSDKPVANPTSFIVGSISKRLGTSVPSASPAKAPAAKAPISKAPVAKAPISKAPVAKAPIAKASIAKAPQAAPASGVGKAPVIRQGLEFEQLAVQAKLQSLNKLDLWTGVHPLDEAALAALLRIDSGRAHEILDEAEEKGAELKNPSVFVISRVREDPR